MTPKEKALHIYEKFYCGSFEFQELLITTSKKCALICVDEILEIYSNFKTHPQSEYWQ